MSTPGGVYGRFRSVLGRALAASDLALTPPSTGGCCAETAIGAARRTSDSPACSGLSFNNRMVLRSPFCVSREELPTNARSSGSPPGGNHEEKRRQKRQKGEPFYVKQLSSE